MTQDMGDALPGPGSCAPHGAPDGSPPSAAIPIAALARNAYRTIDAFGWSIQWGRKQPVPDDAWPIDIIRRAVEAGLQQAARIARNRMAICLSGADHYAERYPDDHYWSSSERCAGWEARHIAELIEAYARGIEASGQDPKGLDAKHKSPAASPPGDAPKLDRFP